MEQAEILTTRIPSPLGVLIAAAVNDELCALEFSDRDLLSTELEEIRSTLNGTIVEGECILFARLRNQLDEYFTGKRQTFDLPIRLVGSDFQQSVWRALLEIPYGTTRSYKEQAQWLGRPDAVRAVAHANGQNRIAIVVPCHRVIGSDGSLIGYGGGLDRKRWLLNLESAASSSSQQRLFDAATS